MTDRRFAERRCTSLIAAHERRAYQRRVMSERRGTYSGQRRQLYTRRKTESVRLSINVDPRHLEALDRYLVLLDTAIGKNIGSLRLKAACGNMEAMWTIDEMRATQRIIGELSTAISVAQEFYFSKDQQQ